MFLHTHVTPPWRAIGSRNQRKAKKKGKGKKKVGYRAPAALPVPSQKHHNFILVWIFRPENDPCIRVWVHILWKIKVTKILSIFLYIPHHTTGGFWKCKCPCFRQNIHAWVGPLKSRPSATVFLQANTWLLILTGFDQNQELVHFGKLTPPHNGRIPEMRMPVFSGIFMFSDVRIRKRKSGLWDLPCPLYVTLILTKTKNLAISAK